MSATIIPLFVLVEPSPDPTLIPPAPVRPAHPAPRRPSVWRILAEAALVGLVLGGLVYLLLGVLLP